MGIGGSSTSDGGSGGAGDGGGGGGGGVSGGGQGRMAMMGASGGNINGVFGTPPRLPPQIADRKIVEAATEAAKWLAVDDRTWHQVQKWFILLLPLFSCFSLSLPVCLV